MTHTAWIREYTLLTWRPAGLTAATVGAVAALAIVATLVNSHNNSTQLLTGGIELGLPLVAGGLAALPAGHDSARELQLSLPTPYRRTLLRRSVLATMWPTLGTAAASIAMFTTQRWMSPAGFVGGQLTWISPLAWTTTMCCLLTVALRSYVAALTAVGVLGVVELLIGSIFRDHSWLHAIYLPATTDTLAHPFWWSNRLDLLAAAATAALATGLLLRRPERLLWEDAS
jgi:hypothetical protein